MAARAKREPSRPKGVRLTVVRKHHHQLLKRSMMLSVRLTSSPSLLLPCADSTHTGCLRTRMLSRYSSGHTQPRPQRRQVWVCSPHATARMHTPPTTVSKLPRRTDPDARSPNNCHISSCSQTSHNQAIELAVSPVAGGSMRPACVHGTPSSLPLLSSLPPYLLALPLPPSPPSLPPHPPSLH